jgi:hypothetical protein
MPYQEKYIIQQVYCKGVLSGIIVLNSYTNEPIRGWDSMLPKKHRGDSPYIPTGSKLAARRLCLRLNYEDLKQRWEEMVR